VAESHCAVMTTTDSAEAAEDLAGGSWRRVLGRVSRLWGRSVVSIGGRVGFRTIRSGSVG
jgi:hypothetical protein